MRLTEMCPPVYVLKPGTDYQAGIDGESINTENCSHVAFLLQFGTLTGDAVLTVNSGASDGTKTTAETFYYRLASAAQGAATADTFGAQASSAGLTLTAATYSNKLMVVEIPCSELTDGQPWLTMNFSAAADALNVAVTAVLLGHRYPGYQPPTSI